MTRRQNFNFTLVIAGALGIGALTAVTAPANLGVALAFGGGLLGGVSVMRERARATRAENDMSLKVTSTFTALYEMNGGLVDPFQLSYLTNIEPERAYSFLKALAENTGGTTITAKDKGHVVFAFPHTKSTLEELTTNAQNWVQAQNQALTLELEKYKQVVSLMQAQQAQQSTANALRQAEPIAEPGSRIDPWTR